MKHTWDNQYVAHKCVYCGTVCIEHDKHNEKCPGAVPIDVHREIIAAILDRVEGANDPTSAMRKYRVDDEIVAIRKELNI